MMYITFDSLMTYTIVLCTVIALVIKLTKQ